MLDHDATMLSVSELNAITKGLLASHFGTVCITGEVSNLSRPASGHLYFTLKDHCAQIRCAYFRFQRKPMDTPIENGQSVIINAQVSLYEPRGDYQLIVNDIMQQGIGQLQIAFEQQKKVLENQGFFDLAHKQPIPQLPHQIGIISSASGAALQDILKVLQRRFPAIPIILYATTVQGEQAAPKIVSAIHEANRAGECDVLILARGGGTIEDLWAFNETPVAKAIYDSKIPIITGIGHQTDFTIADFVADKRAATPSAAAETAVPDQQVYLTQINEQTKHLYRYLTSVFSQARSQLLHLQKRLKHPSEKLSELAQTLDYTTRRLAHTMQKNLSFYQLEHQQSHHQLLSNSPLHQLPKLHSTLEKSRQSLTVQIQHQLEKSETQLGHIAATLDALSPLKTLKRGYSITRLKSSYKIMTSAKDVKPGDQIVTELESGQLYSIVTESASPDHSSTQDASSQE